MDVGMDLISIPRLTAIRCWIGHSNENRRTQHRCLAREENILPESENHKRGPSRLLHARSKSDTLEEFLSDTLLEIVDGVADAKVKNERISPRVTGGDKPVVSGFHRASSRLGCRFDVAVTVSRTTNSGAKGGVAIHVFEAAGHGSSALEQSTVSRIKFEVPVTFG